LDGGTSGDRTATDGGRARLSSTEGFTGRKLGPDPYSRLGADRPAGAPGDRPLAADLPPDATLDEKSDELSLSGLLGGRGRSHPQPDPAADSGSQDFDEDLDVDGDDVNPER
jgi:hypothetical protein